MARDLVFISYRSEDTGALADRYGNALRRQVGATRVFFDAANTVTRQKLPQQIQTALNQCRVLIVLIGVKWLKAVDDAGHRRIDDPADRVHQELSIALRDWVVEVIPVLVDDAQLPSLSALPAPLARLARWPAARLERPRFARHIEQIAIRIRDLDLSAASDKRRSGAPPALPANHPASSVRSEPSDADNGTTAPSPASATPIRIFVSYGHDSEQHQASVRALVERLRQDGLEAWFDEFENPPPEGWPRWMQKQVMTACFVLVVCTESFRQAFEGNANQGERLGANWEGFLTQQLLYADDARNLRYIPVLLEGARPADVPLALQATTYYRLPEGYERLYRRLTAQPPVAPAPLGMRKTLSSADAERDPELVSLKEEKKRLTLAGEDTSEIAEMILRRRRQLRDSDDVGRGTRLDDRFELIEQVGSGGFATVWQAFDHRHECVVAVKILHRQHVDDRTRRERFFRGAQRMASLRHPHVVRVIEEHGQDGKASYFVMDYLRGGDLLHRVRSGRWRQHLTMPTLLRMAEALQCAHEIDLVHRDVKPGNILLDDRDAALLTDFDLVHAADTTGGTRTGALGTFMYAAPEALGDASRTDARADVYSLSMVGIFLLLGKDLPAQALRDSAVLIDSLPVSIELKRVLAKGCAWTPDERFQTMEEMVDALRAVAAPDAGGDVPERGGSSV